MILFPLHLGGALFSKAYEEGLHYGWLIFVGIISVIGASHLANALVNWIATLVVQPDFLPRMDYSKGIPPESRTLVVVPTLLEYSGGAGLTDRINGSPLPR